MIKISIISATYNSAKVLPGLIESLRAQVDKNFEWVAADGGSTDGTLDLLKSSRDVLSDFVSEPDHGIYDAINKALKKINGEYYLILGADDRLFPDAVLNYRKALLESSADIITAKAMLGQKILRRHKNRPAWVAGMMKYVSNHAVGSLIKTSLHDKLGPYSLDYQICADQLFIKTAFQNNASLVDADFVAGICGSAGASSNTPRVISEIYKIQVQTGENCFLQRVLYLFRMLRWVLKGRK